jgi:hypothetical protein
MNQVITLPVAHLHLLPSEQLREQRVSAKSLWTDPVWRLDHSTPGLPQQKASVKWNINLPNGLSLLDPELAELLEHLRRFVWSLLADPREGKSLKTSSLSSISRMIAFLVEWMVLNDYHAITELDNAASWEYAEYVKACCRNKMGRAGRSWIWSRLHILTLLYKQSSALSAAGVQPLPEPPLDGRNPFAVAKELGRHTPYFIPPLPDYVALPIMAAAERLIGQPAYDVIGLQSRYLEAYAIGGPGNHIGPGHSVPIRTNAARRALSQFTFSVLPGESQPWRGGIDTRKQAGHDFVAEIRELIMDVRNACIIVLQSHVGLRISEVMGLKGDADPLTGLPSCIETRPSRTGLNTHFYLKGVVAKIQNRQTEWLIGSIPADSEDYPPPVRSLIVLERLFRPWRELGGLDLLTVSFTARALPKNAKSVGKPYSEKINLGQKAFVRRYVTFDTVNDAELDRYRDGSGLRTHQWRKTFALYLFRVDSRMLPAISQHFKHLSLAMTEQGYIGKDWELMGAMCDVRQQATTRMLYEAATGDTKYAGNMAAWMESYRADYRKEDLPTKEIYRRIENEVLNNDLRIWFSEYGKCFIQVDLDQARCHQIAGTINESCPIPHFEYREPAVCVGCANFLIDGEHAGFWRDRYRQNQTAVLNAEHLGRGGEFYVARQRAKQAAAILRALGLEVPEVDHETQD